MKLKNLKIEICELPDEMGIVSPTWRAYDSETGEDVVLYTEAIRERAMHMMWYCAIRLRESLEYNKITMTSQDIEQLQNGNNSKYLKDMKERLEKAGINPGVVFKSKGKSDGMGASQKKS